MPGLGNKAGEGVTAIVSTPGDQLDLAAITSAASREAGGVPPDLLGDFLAAVHAAALTGRRLDGGRADRARPVGRAGRGGRRRPAGLVDLYLSAAWRLWRELPDPGGAVATRAAGLAVLRARTTPWPPRPRASSGPTYRSLAARRPIGSSSSTTCSAAAATCPSWWPAGRASGSGWPGRIRSCWSPGRPGPATAARRGWPWSGWWPTPWPPRRRSPWPGAAGWSR